jgi:hypothetical protein
MAKNMKEKTNTLNINFCIVSARYISAQILETNTPKTKEVITA